MPKAKRIDHVSIAVPSLDEALTFFDGVFDVKREKVKFFESADFYGAIFHVGESKFELLAPKGEDSFLHRFLDKGPGFHHVTVQVESLAAMRERLNELGIATFGGKKATGGFDETFIHPKSAYGVLFQIMEEVWEDIAEQE